MKEVQCLTGRVATLNKFISRATDKCLTFFKALKKGKYFRWTEECEFAFQGLKQFLGQPPFLSKPRTGEPLLLYLAVSMSAISAVLVREEGAHWPIYHVS